MDANEKLTALYEIVSALDAQKSRLYDLAQDAEGSSLIYGMIDRVQEAMTSVSQEALKIERKLENDANKRLMTNLLS